MIFIAVVVPNSKAQQVEPFLAQCCAEVGDEFLGRRLYPETNERLCLVRLLEDPHLSKHLPILGQALENNLITSFRFVHGSVLKLSSPNILEQIQRFPFILDDTWLPPVERENEIYLCIARSLLTGLQAAWLHLRPEIRWEYL